MNTRARVAAAALTFAVAFSAGIVGGAHDYIFNVSAATESASLLSGLSGNQLAGEGGLGGDYGGSPTPPSGPSASSEGHPPTSHSNPPPPPPPSSRSSGDSCGGCGYGGGTPSPSPSSGSGNSNQGSGNTSADSRDHQDTAASRAAEQQAQQVREAANYAQKLSGYGSGDPTPARTSAGISATISNTFSALGDALSNLMGGPAQPTITTRPGTIIGLDGRDPVYSPSTLQVGDFKNPTNAAPDQNLGSGAPTDLSGTLNTAATDATPPHYVTSAATLNAVRTLREIDTLQMTQAAALQAKLHNKISTADSIVSASEIDKVVAGECASGACSQNERVAIANAIMNRINVAAANKTTLDIHDVLDAFDANMQRPRTLDNKVYATADVGTPEYAAGAAALNAVLSGNLPADMPDAVKNATNYHTLSTNPSWAKGVAETPYGPHTFSDANGATAAQVQAAKDKVAAGDIKAEISYYKGINDPNSPQAVKIQAEVNRSLTVAGRTVDIVTESTGVTQGPSVGQTAQTVKDTQVPTGPPQKTSLDDPKNSNVPSPADVKKFLVDRGMDPNAPINGQFAYRLSSAIAAAETATGKKQTNVVNSGYRTPEEQAGLYATYIKQDYVFKGVTYHPNPANLGHLAAAPAGGLIAVGPLKGTIAPGSRHQFGAATDLNAGPIRDYVRANAEKFGLETLGTKPDGTLRDVPHVQLSSSIYSNPTLGKNAAPLDASIGAGGLGGSQAPGTTNTPDAQPAVTKTPDDGLAPKSWIPSFADLKKKAADAVTAVTPSQETQKKLEFVSKLPSWMQNIVMSFYTGTGGGAPSSNTESHSSGSTIFPIADHATTTRAQRTAPQKVDVTTLPWWQQYQAKLKALKQSEQQSI